MTNKTSRSEFTFVRYTQVGGQKKKKEDGGSLRLVLGLLKGKRETKCLSSKAAGRDARQLLAAQKDEKERGEGGGYRHTSLKQRKRGRNGFAEYFAHWR